MDNPPARFTPAQLEAQNILKHLLSKLQERESKYHARYGKWIDRHPRLDDFCFRCIRPQVWVFLNGRWSLDGLKAIGGDRTDVCAVYLNGVLGLDKRVRIYVGQAFSLRSRIAQHLNFRYRRDNPSLHYYALQRSIYNAIGVLAVLPSPSMGGHALPGMDDPSLLLNLLEMWMGLVLRSLPTSMLEEWLPEGVSQMKEGREGVFGGLNIMCPLDQGNSKSGWIDLSESGDPLVREYLGVDATKTPEVKDNAQDEVEKRKKEYAEKARNMNQVQNDSSVSANALIAFGMGVVLGFALMKGLSGPMRR
ncbi:hypothetical protein N0V86_003993 [Didymella sp. IMI 355093]|nr:hypothetical protein N0V86_003993 [Didymella sp. IMI 355093]